MTRSEADLLRHAMLEHRAGRFAAAAEIYRRLLATEPENAEVWHLLGVVHLQTGDPEEAVRALGRATGLLPGNPAFHVNLGGALGATGRNVEAIVSYRRALDLDPGFHDAHLNLGNALLRTGRFEEAAAHYRRAIEIEPGRPGGHGNLGTALKHLGREEEALGAYDRALELDPGHFDSLYNRANLLRRLGRGPEAVDAGRAAVRLRPGDASARNLLGLALLEAGSGEEAAREFRRAVDLDPALANPHANLGVVHRDREEREAAIAELRRAIELDPAHADAWNNLGAVLHETGRFEEGAEASRRALRIRPERADAHYNLAASLQELGRTPEAVAAYEAALERDPAFSPAYRNLVTLFTALDREEEALAWLERWERHDPEDPVLTHLLASHRKDEAPARADDAYVRRVFDDFARGYEAKLETLGYRVPGLIGPALAACGLEPDRSLAILDAGCGTGLCGPHLRPFASRLVGVDLSAGMLSRARARPDYDELAESEITRYLAGSPGAFDAIVSADTFNYFGALEDLLRAAFDALRSPGVLLFTTEDAPAGTTATFELRPHGRYRHAKRHVLTLLSDAGFAVLSAVPEVLRHEANEPVAGVLVTARKP